MTRYQASVVLRWAWTVRNAVALGEADAAFRITVGLVRRCRELGVL